MRKEIRYVGCIRRAFALILLISTAFAPTMSDAQGLSNSPVTIIVPFPAGGAIDALARTVQPKLQANLGVPVIIENRAGASGTTGAIAVSRATPDGHTLLLASNNVTAINSYFFKNPNFNPLKDLAPITTATRGPIALAVHPSVAVHTLKAFVEYAQKNDISVAVPGIGTAHHMLAEYLSRLAGYKMTVIPYRGSGPQITDVLAGHVKFGFFTMPSIIAHAETGAVRLIAIGDGVRLASAPNVPSIAETFPGFDISQWNAFYAPSGTPEDIIDKLNQQLVKTLRDPEVQKSLENLGTPVLADKPEELAKRQKDEFERWGPVVRDMKIDPQ